MTTFTDIDAAHGEGGGQLVRTAVALAAITGTPIRLLDVRAGRSKPGLAPQHLAAVRAVAALCAAECEGLELRARTFAFEPRALRGGTFRFDVGTAGSITLVLQALLPVMVSSGSRCDVTVIGGTDVRQAPPFDYLRHVLVAHLARLGVRVEIELRRRGYYPRGGGEVHAALEPAPLRPLTLESPGAPRGIGGLAHVANLPMHIAERMRDAALGALGPARGASRIDAAVLPPDTAIGAGGAIVAWAESEHTVVGAARAAERGVRAEALGEAVGAEIAADLAAGATVDAHAADQLLVWLGLARGGTFLARELTAHARTAIWLIEQFLPVRFRIEPQGRMVRITAVPR